MEIKIAKNGYNIGTVGWLAKGLDDGTLKISEGTMKSTGNHGLWLTAGEISQFLAAYNQHGITANDFLPNELQYKTADVEDRGPIFTDACWSALMDIAQQWCDERNRARDNDQQKVGFKIIFE